MKTILTAALISATLIGCATNRSNADDYELVSKGNIHPDRLQTFRDCVNDSFQDRTIGLGVVLFNRMQVRKDMWRIELVSNELGPMLSADLMNDGNFELHEITYPSRFRVSGERESFIQCAKSNAATFSM